MSVSEPLQLLGRSRSRIYTHSQLVFRSSNALVSHVNFTTSCGGGAISERRCSAALSSSLSQRLVNRSMLNRSIRLVPLHHRATLRLIEKRVTNTVVKCANGQEKVNLKPFAPLLFRAGTGNLLPGHR